MTGKEAVDTKRNIPRVLIAEGCTHHRQCDDIGTVKLPGWIRNYTGLEPEFTFVSGTEFPDDLTGYDLIIHCGGCMLNERDEEQAANGAAAGSSYDKLWNGYSAYEWYTGAESQGI